MPGFEGLEFKALGLNPNNIKRIKNAKSKFPHLIVWIKRQHFVFLLAKIIFRWYRTHILKTYIFIIFQALSLSTFVEDTVL